MKRVRRLPLSSRLVACALAGAALALAPGAYAASTVDVTLWNQGAAMGITTDKPSVPAGKVTFDARNASKELVHEMLVVQVKNYHDALPYDEKTARVIEDDVKDYGEVSELEPGQSGSVTLNLKPGKYLLLCNQPGHFEMGMSTHLIVTP